MSGLIVRGAEHGWIVETRSTGAEEVVLEASVGVAFVSWPEV